MAKRGTGAVVLLVALLASCSLSTGLDPDPEATLTFGIQRLANEPPFQVVLPPTGAIRLRGFFTTPCSPYEARARAEQRNGVVTLYVRGRDEDGNCPLDVVAAVGYQAEVRNVDSRGVTLRVVHEWADADWPSVEVYTVEIPARPTVVN